MCFLGAFKEGFFFFFFGGGAVLKHILICDLNCHHPIKAIPSVVVVFKPTPKTCESRRNVVFLPQNGDGIGCHYHHKALTKGLLLEIPCNRYSFLEGRSLSPGCSHSYGGQ